MRYFESKKEAKYAIKAQTPSFEFFLEQILGQDLFDYLKTLSQFSDIYLFSGIIRDFFIGNLSALSPRDIDLVINGNFSISHLTRVSKLSPRKNSFDGIKLTFNNLNIDIWNIKDTWGIKHFGKKVNINALLNSVFFNFSAIVYSFRESKFIFDDNFVDFLVNRRMEIVLPENPNLVLSQFNIYYYAQKLDIQVGTSVVEWLNKKFSFVVDYRDIQKRHIGCIVEPTNEIISFLINLISKDV